jgi:hypothetical protein
VLVIDMDDELKEMLEEVFTYDAIEEFRNQFRDDGTPPEEFEITVQFSRDKLNKEFDVSILR